MNRYGVMALATQSPRRLRCTREAACGCAEAEHRARRVAPGCCWVRRDARGACPHGLMSSLGPQSSEVLLSSPGSVRVCCVRHALRAVEQRGDRVCVLVRARCASARFSGNDGRCECGSGDCSNEQVVRDFAHTRALTVAAIAQGANCVPVGSRMLVGSACFVEGCARGIHRVECLQKDDESAT